MMEVQLSVVPDRAAQQVTVDVSLPIYRRHALDGGTIYTKIVSPTEGLQVYVRDDGGIEVEADDGLGGMADMDYHLGRGKYACTAEEWDAAYAKAVALLARFAS